MLSVPGLGAWGSSTAPWGSLTIGGSDGDARLGGYRVKHAAVRANGASLRDVRTLVAPKSLLSTLRRSSTGRQDVCALIRSLRASAQRLSGALVTLF